MSRMGAGREWVRGWRFERRRSMVWLLCGRVVVRTCCCAGSGCGRGLGGFIFWEGEVVRLSILVLDKRQLA